MIDIVESSLAEHALELTVLPNVTPNKVFSLAGVEIASKDLVASRNELLNKMSTDEATAASHKHRARFQRYPSFGACLDVRPSTNRIPYKDSDSLLSPGENAATPRESARCGKLVLSSASSFFGHPGAPAMLSYIEELSRGALAGEFLACDP